LCLPRSTTVSAVSLVLYNMYTTCHALMAMTVVPIRLSRKDARKLDLLVRLGLYNSRTEAMRAMIQATADEQLNMLHLTYAKTMRETVPDLETFTTLDGDIISRRNEIENELDITVVSPLDRP